MLNILKTIVTYLSIIGGFEIAIHFLPENVLVVVAGLALLTFAGRVVCGSIRCIINYIHYIKN